jgi:hypothetical protein
MGKSDTPPAPDYTKSAIATANAGKYNETSPFGSVNWSLRPGADVNNIQPGDYIRDTSLAPDQQALMDQGTKNQLQLGLVGSELAGNLGGNAQEMQDALYRRGTQYYDQRFNQGEDALRTRLENSGLMAGSAGYDNQLEKFQQDKNTAYADATDRALIGSDQSQNSQVSRLAQIMAMSRGQTPQSGSASAAGPDLLGATNQQYQTAVGANNAQNAQAGQTASTIGQLATLAIMMSDRRLKSDIIPVGTGAYGLTVYDYTIFGRRERGYMAQEVAEKLPSAVHRHASGYLMVDYSALGGRP